MGFRTGAGAVFCWDIAVVEAAARARDAVIAAMISFIVRTPLAHFIVGAKRVNEAAGCRELRYGGLVLGVPLWCP
jgi:hypothetical protein